MANIFLKMRRLKARRGHFGQAKIIGLIILSLALIGVIVTLSFTGKTISKLFDDTKLKTELESLISPIVMYDPVPFESINKAEGSMIIQTSIWAVMGSDEKSHYSFDDFGRMLIPATDVEKYAAKLYGKSLKLTHQSFTEMGSTFEYDKQTKKYLVPVDAISGYYPVIEKIKRVKKDYILTVGYIPPLSWGSDIKGNKLPTTPDKRMFYIVRKDKEGYHLFAIKDHLDDKKSSSTSKSSSRSSITSSSSISSKVSSTLK